MDDLKTILDRIRKPLAFAARDEFAHVKSLTAVEPFMALQVKELKKLAPERPGLQELENLFSGIDALSPDQKKERILRATALINAFEHGGAEDAPQPQITQPVHHRDTRPHTEPS